MELHFLQYDYIWEKFNYISKITTHNAPVGPHYICLMSLHFPNFESRAWQLRHYGGAAGSDFNQSEYLTQGQM